MYPPMLMTLLQHLQAILILPVTVAVLVPGVLLYTAGPGRFSWPLSAPAGVALAGLGVLLIGLGLWLAIHTIALFATAGQGTLAPWTPTQKLVVRGIYRHVRNPMIGGVWCVLLGEILVFGVTALAWWCLFFALANLVYIPLLEEPGLERRFGESYRRYKKNVPRWIPRLKPWGEAEG